MNVAVIGAGISGLTCARALVDHGLTVHVFDEGPGPGGRMSARTDGGLTFDHGAQYFTARDPVFSRAVAAWIAAGVVAVWDGRIEVLGGAVSRDGQRPTRHVGTPTMAAVCRALASGLDVSPGIRIAAVEPCNGGQHLRDEAGRQHGVFDTVVVAVPGPRAAPLLAASPLLASMAAATPMAPCWAAMVAFEQRLDVAFDAAFIHDSPLSWVALQRSKPGRPDVEAWVLHATGAWTEAHLDRSGDDVTVDLVAALSAAAAVELPTLRFGSAHQWCHALPTDPHPPRYLYDDGARLGACGDWCGGPRVEGAYLSGVALAQRIITEIDRPR